ncbi:protein-tyrosine-phosphatase [Neorhizobium sp. 2083]|nr:protein-tyrosine-phosphatase [Neorhizobium sp. 2083]
MTADRVYNVLFLCTGNSARSIIAEAILNRLGTGKFKAYSAGSQPKGEVHPYTIDLLKGLNYRTEFARSKNWDEFAAPGAPQMDFVFTVCDNAASESCPVWPGQPMTGIGAYRIRPLPRGKKPSDGLHSRKHTACCTTAFPYSPACP